MAIKITDECINCGACEPECPNNAIYDAGTAWRFSDGTNLNGVIDFGDQQIEAESSQDAISDEVYYIVSDKCTECKGFHDEPQCAAVCPVDCCVDDEDVRETEEELKKGHSFECPFFYITSSYLFGMISTGHAAFLATCSATLPIRK
jgi:ferredoxin